MLRYERVFQERRSFQDSRINELVLKHVDCFSDSLILENTNTLVVDYNVYYQNGPHRWQTYLYVKGDSVKKYYNYLKMRDDVFIKTQEVSLQRFGEDEAVIVGDFIINEKYCVDPYILKHGLSTVADFPIVYVDGIERIVLRRDNYTHQWNDNYERFTDDLTSNNPHAKILKLGATNLEHFKYITNLKRGHAFVNFAEAITKELLPKIIEKILKTSDQDKILYIMCSKAQTEGITLKQVSNQLGLTYDSLRYKYNKLQVLNRELNKVIADVMERYLVDASKLDEYLQALRVDRYTKERR